MTNNTLCETFCERLKMLTNLIQDHQPCLHESDHYQQTCTHAPKVWNDNIEHNMLKEEIWRQLQQDLTDKIDVHREEKKEVEFAHLQALRQIEWRATRATMLSLLNGGSSRDKSHYFVPMKRTLQTKTKTCGQDQQDLVRVRLIDLDSEDSQEVPTDIEIEEITSEATETEYESPKLTVENTKAKSPRKSLSTEVEQQSSHRNDQIDPNHQMEDVADDQKRNKNSRTKLRLTIGFTEQPPELSINPKRFEEHTETERVRLSIHLLVTENNNLDHTTSSVCTEPDTVLNENFVDDIVEKCRRIQRRITCKIQAISKQEDEAYASQCAMELCKV